MTSPKFYLTTPIYYVNARPHIGHAYSTIVADVIARRHRLLGDDTFFLTGTDEHGQKIERSAQAAGVPPQAFADQVSETFRALWKRMGITNDDYIRTTEERHKRGVQKLFTTLKENGYIYLDTYTGQYCVSDEAFVEVGPGEPCPDCGRITETISESNYYFKLSAFGEKLLALIDPAVPNEGPHYVPEKMVIEPASARNEVLAFIRSGLKDLSISRSSFKWGIPVPGDEAHVIYVWLDALANYMTAVGYGDPAKADEFAKWWPADLHLVGKEITRFHCVYWPAFLMAAGLPTPKAIVANGWLLFEESKMSKSKGNVVRTETILDGFGSLKPELSKAEQDLFGADVLRYFLLREIPFGQDGSFSFDALVTRYNADLANGYGNLVSRVLNLIQQNFSGVIPTPPEQTVILATSSQKNDQIEISELSPERYYTGTNPVKFGLQDTVIWTKASWDRTELTAALALVVHNVGAVDAYLTNVAPWKLAKDRNEMNESKLRECLYTAAEGVRFIAAQLYPVLPYATARVWEQLGLGDIEAAAKNGELKDLRWGGLKPGTKLGVLGPIFPRADKGLVETMTNMEAPAGAIKPNDDQTEGAAVPVASTAPHAGPRTGELSAASSGSHVGGSDAVTTERVGTPPHTEAVASGVFREAAAVAAVPDTAQIGIDDFVKVDLRVAQIVVAERIPKADKLLRLEVDLGYEKRQILSGIAEWYQPEELIGRKIVIIANLAPRKMRGLESHGMLLAASHGEHGKPVLATFGEEIALGSRIK
jgi:methionyl-tRNA synthetase